LIWRPRAADGAVQVQVTARGLQVWEWVNSASEVRELPQNYRGRDGMAEAAKKG
jgi:hypothetical protein